MSKELTNKQKAFVREYLKDCNGAQAAIRAGYAPAYADRQAYLLLENPRVAEAVKKAQDKRAAKAEVTAEFVLRRLLEESEYSGEDGSASARIKATELLGKHLGLFEDRLRVSQDGPVEIIVKRATKKEAGNGQGEGEEGNN